MLRSVKSIHGSRLEAIDGEIGRADDFYFDDESWKVRYLVADTGTWLPRRLVLLSPAALGTPSDWAVPVSLPKAKIENSPGISTHEPVSRLHEKRIAAHYGWPPYWKDDDVVLEAATDRCVEEHLRSAHEITGYEVEATDGSIGHIHDLIIETEEWTIRYVVVDLSVWLPARKVLLSPVWFHRIEWEHGTVHLELTREDVKRSPHYHPSEPINRVYEDQLYDFYGRPKYWQ